MIRFCMRTADEYFADHTRYDFIEEVDNFKQDVYQVYVDTYRYLKLLYSNCLETNERHYDFPPHWTYFWIYQFVL